MAKLRHKLKAYKAKIEVKQYVLRKTCGSWEIRDGESWDVFQMCSGGEIDVHKAKQVGISGMGECKLVREFI